MSRGWAWVILWVVELFLQGARLSVDLVSSSSIRALIMGVRAQEASRRPASRWPALCSWCLGWGADCSHSGGDAHLQDRISVNQLKSGPSLVEKIHTEINKNTYLQLPPVEEVSTELPAPDGSSFSGYFDFLRILDWLVWRNGDFLPSDRGQGDFLRETSGSGLHLLGDSSRSGWWKRLLTCEEEIYIQTSLSTVKICFLLAREGLIDGDLQAELRQGNKRQRKQTCTVASCHGQIECS